MYCTHFPKKEKITCRRTLGLLHFISKINGVFFSSPFLNFIKSDIVTRGQRLMVAHWLSVAGDPGSNPSKVEKFSFIIFDLVSK